MSATAPSSPLRAEATVPSRSTKAKAEATVAWPVAKHLLVVGSLVAAYLLYLQLLAAYDGWLGWDDSSHAEVALRQLREARESWIPLPIALWEGFSHAVPRPPLSSALFAILRAVAPRMSFLTAIYLSTWGMLVLQAVLVFAVARRSSGPWAGYLAVVCLLASLTNISVGLLLISELHLSILFLIATVLYVRELRAPTWGNEVLLGLTLGLAMLTKQSSPALFGINWIIVLIGLAMKHGSASVGRYTVLSLGTAALGCLWWYVPNVKTILFYLSEAFGHHGFLDGENPYTFSFRLFIFVIAVWGPPATFAWLYLFTWYRRTPRGWARHGEDFQRFAGLTLATTAALLVLALSVYHFEPRYFHVTLPALAVIAGVMLHQTFVEGPIWARLLIAPVLVLACAFVAMTTIDTPKSRTDWSAIPFLEKIHDPQRSLCIGLVGNTGDWNCDKIRVLNELTEKPTDRYFIQLTDGRPHPNWYNEMRPCDYILFLPRLEAAYHSGYSHELSNLNYDEMRQYLLSPDGHFRRVQSRFFVIPADLWLFERIAPTP